MSGLPFTADQFFQVFADYNRSFLPVVVILWLVTAGVLVAGWRHASGSGRLVCAWLAALWAWNAVAYHAFLFTRINPAAWFFAALFVVQAGLFLMAAGRQPLVFFTAGGANGAIGAGLAIYGLAYPALTAASGHPYPFAPTFGVPCPTTIFTVGVLLTVRGGPPWRLMAVPLVWALIGGSAAVLLGVRTDYALLATAVLAPVLLFAGRRRVDDEKPGPDRALGSR